MKKNVAIILIITLMLSIIPLSVIAEGYRSSLSDNEKGTGDSGAQPTISPSLDPIMPSLEPMPTNIPLPTAEPGPSFPPKPDYEFNGPDENGLWHSGYISYEKLSPVEIKRLFENAVTTPTQPIFDIYPSTQYEPYVIGQLTQENLEICRNYFNVMRRLGGLNNVELNDEANMYAQYAAWMMCHNQSLTHTPACLVGVPTEWCNLGYYGCTHSNVARTTSIYGFTNGQIDGYMNEWQSNNVAEVGHRQEILDTRLVDVGFGSAGLYHANFIGHKDLTAQIDEYDFISWPSSDYFPSDTNAFSRLSPWSISFKKGTIANPTIYGNLTITILKNGEEIDTLTYNVDPNYPESITAPTPYITIESTFTNNYCIIFRPDLTNNITYDGTFTVIISGLCANRSFEALDDIVYEVNFFKLADVELEPEPSITLLGDVNCNGQVDAIDALLLLRYTMALIPENTISEQGLINANVNHDNIIDTMDALLIIRASLGIIELT